MADTYTQLCIHIVFAVKGRQQLLPTTSLPRVHEYIAGTIRRKNHKPIIVGGIEDHVHILVGLNPAESISDLVRDVKAFSSSFVKRERLAPPSFRWQKGYGAFSLSRRQVPRVFNYIKHQREHHARRTFHQEYEAFLRSFDVVYDPRYLFSDE